MQIFNPPRALARTLALSTLALVGACQSTIQSVRISPRHDVETINQATRGERHALTYGVPMRMVRLTITGSPTTPAALAAAVNGYSDALKAKSDAEALLRTYQARVLELQGQQDTTPAVLAAAQAAVQNQQAEVRRLTSAANTAEANLTLQQARLTGLAGAAPTDRALSIKFELAAPIADPRAQYVSTFDHYWHRDDTVALSTTADGLLTTSNVTQRDRTAEILVDFAGIVGAGRAPGEVGAFVAPAGGTDPCGLGRSFAREFTFDPSTEENITEDGVSIPGWGTAKTFMKNCLGLDLTIPEIDAFENVPDASARGLVYRRPIPYMISVTRGTDDTQDVLASTVAMLPQGGPYGVIPYEPRTFVTSVTNVSFDNGQPTQWHTDNPSEVAAVFRIPVAMARALVEVPATLVQLRVNYDTRHTELVEAQRSYICALEALAEAEGQTTPGNCADD